MSARRPAGALGLAKALRSAGFSPRPLDEGGPVPGFALGPVLPGGPEGLAFVEREGATLALRIPLPPQCEMAGLAPVAERALKMLGAISLGLSAQGMQAIPLARYRGTEAVLLSVHLCPPLGDGARLRTAFERLRATAHRLGKALQEPPDRILVALRQAAGVHGTLVATRGRGDVAAVPSFDPEAGRKPGRAVHRRRAGR